MQYLHTSDLLLIVMEKQICFCACLLKKHNQIQNLPFLSSPHYKINPSEWGKKKKKNKSSFLMKGQEVKGLTF